MSELEPACRPNILFVLADQHRGDWTTARGATHLRTPNMDRLAAEGARFDRAICPSPLCVPSRICMATGRDYGEAPERSRPLRDNRDVLPAEIPNFYQRLRAAGYRVAACGKSDLRKPLMSWGSDGRHVVDGTSEWDRLGFSDGVDSAGKHDAWEARRAGRPEPYLAMLDRYGLADIHMADFDGRPYPDYVNCSPTPLPPFAYADNYVGAQALELIRGFGADPWFLQVNFAGPHEPMDVTVDMRARVEARDVPMPEPLDARVTREQHRSIRRNYTAMIENIDAWLGHFLAALEAAGDLDKTIVVYASDHGEMLGEQDEWTKWVPYRPSIEVPLLVRGPGILHDAHSSPASLIDLGPTFLELAGAEPLAGIGGRSLLPRLSGLKPEAGEVRIAGLGCWRAVVSATHSLIVGYRHGMTHAEMMSSEWSGGCDSPLLFDHSSDPGERHSLAHVQPGTVAALFETLKELLGRG